MYFKLDNGRYCMYSIIQDRKTKTTCYLADFCKGFSEKKPEIEKCTNLRSICNVKSAHQR